MRFSRFAWTRNAVMTAFAASACLYAQTVPAPELPHAGSVFAVEGSAAPVHVHASETAFNGHTGSNFARGLVYAGPHRTMDVTGPTASLTLHTATPVFYVRLGDEDPEIARNRIELLHLGIDGADRSVVTFTNNAFGGNLKRHETAVPITKSDTSDPAFVQVKPGEKLEPGEYAIVYMPGNQATAPTLVYDFSVVNDMR